MKSVTLENYELWVAMGVGSRRQFSATMKRSKPRFSEQYPGQLHDNHQRSAMAEMAVAKHLNIYWGGHVDVYRDLPDVGGYEVRWSLRDDLKVREDDTGVIISVTGHPPTFLIVGWIDADEGKRDEWQNDFGYGNPAYFVPHSELHNIDRLTKPTIIMQETNEEWLKAYGH